MKQRLCAVAFFLLAASASASDFLRDSGPYRPFDQGGTKFARRVAVDPSALDQAFVLSVGGRRIEVNDAEREYRSSAAVQYAVALAPRALKREEADLPRSADMVLRFKTAGALDTSTITRYGNVVVATLALEEGRFDLEPELGGDIYSLKPSGEISCNVLEPQEAYLTPAVMAEAVAHSSRRRAVRVPGPEVTVQRHLLVYSDSLVALAGSQEAAKAILQHSVNVVNTANADTGGLASIKDEIAAMVYLEKSPYDDATDAIYNIWKDAQIVALSVQYKAGLVGFWHTLAANYGGTGVAYSYKVGNFKEYGFYEIIFSKYAYEKGLYGTVIHEVGHVKGLAHEWEGSIHDYLYPYAYGYSNCETELRDVMSGAMCYTQQLMRYSNVAATVQGIAPPVVLGSERSDGARVIRNTATVVRDLWQLRGGT